MLDDLLALACIFAAVPIALAFRVGVPALRAAQDFTYMLFAPGPKMRKSRR